MGTFRGVLALSGFIAAFAMPNAVHAQLGVGTWQRQSDKGSKEVAAMTMTVDPCCNGGYRLTYHIEIGDTKSVMKVESPFDGTAVPVFVDGKPSGETMAIKRLDDHRYTAVMKMNGAPFGTSNGTVSADSKTLTVESVSNAGGKADKVIETWVKK